jgi:OHCU decarboxylase
MTTHTLAAINAISVAEAVVLLGGVFEHSPWVVERTWNQAPFASREALHAALVATVEAASEADQLALIRAHPDLVGRAALAGTLTRESTVEQRAAGLGPDDLSEGDRAQFTNFNTAYQERFGFPFVICARENRKASILQGFQDRIDHDAGTERRIALREIARIAWYRLTDLIEE